MTIVFRGHVDKLEFAGTAKTILTLKVEASVCLEPIRIEVDAKIAEQYKPGTPIQVTIYPLVAAPPAKGER